MFQPTIAIHQIISRLGIYNSTIIVSHASSRYAYMLFDVVIVVGVGLELDKLVVDGRSKRF